MFTKINQTENVCDNCHFRPKLKDRWSVFFEAMGAGYKYQPKEYECTILSITGLEKYLPDFVIGNMFIEIRPAGTKPHDLFKLLNLCDATNIHTLVLVGSPGIGKYKAFYISKYEDETGPIAIIEGTLGTCRKCRALAFIGKQGGEHEAFAFVFGECEVDCNNKMQAKFPLTGEVCHRVQQALTVAQQARFEHGERP